MISRREFLAAAIPAALIIPELVVPKTRFFLPPPGGWPKNVIEIATSLGKYQYVWGNSANLENWEKRGYKMAFGDTLVPSHWDRMEFPFTIRLSEEEAKQLILLEGLRR